MKHAMLWLDRTLVEGPFLALALSKKQFHATMKHLKVPRKRHGKWINDGANATMHTLESPRGMACVVAMNLKGCTKTQARALLVHEAVHVWQHYRERIGEGQPSTEFEAYAIQGIAQSLMLGLKRQS